MKITNKKGIEISNAFGAVLAVVLIAVLVIIAIFLFQTIGDGFSVTSTTVLNEEPAFINETIYTVTNSTACNFQNFVITSAVNGSSTKAIVSANWTIDAVRGTVINATAIGWGNVTLNYTYSSGGEACTASETMIDQFATYPALVGLVGTIVFLGLVIGVLVASFVFGGKRRV